MGEQFGLGDLMDITSAYWQSRALLTAVELDIFEALADGAMTPDDLAAKLGCDGRALGLLANSLAGLGVLNKCDGKLTNSAFAREHLVESRGGTMVGYLRHHGLLWRHWTALTDAVRTGEVERTEFKGGEVRAFIMAMHTTSSHWGGRVADHIDLAGVERLIDIGGGSGDYSYEILRRVPEATAVIFDREEVVPITMECAEMAGVADRVSTVAGDYWEDDLGEGFDLAIISNILHSANPDGCVTILSKAEQCLKPGGRVVIHEFVLSADGTEPAYAALFSLNMLTAGNDGRSYSRPELEEYLGKAGFSDVRHVRTTGDTSIVVGTKS